MFAVHRIDEQLAKAMERKVWLPSGGTLVIDRTEAMTVVDVNTGKFTGSGGNLEQTVTKNNLEAAEEIVRQLRLRDIGGIVVIDFIDMVLESNRDLVLRRLTESLARDRTRHQVSEVTSLGLVQLTRKRLGTGLIEAFSTSCPQLRRPRDPAACRPGRLGPGDRAQVRVRRSARQAIEEEPIRRARGWPRCPRTRRASTRCSRRWPPAGHGDGESGEAGEELTAEVDEQTEATKGSRRPEDTDQGDFEDTDEDEDAEDIDDEDDDSTTKTTTTSSTTTTRTSTTRKTSATMTRTSRSTTTTWTSRIPTTTTETEGSAKHRGASFGRSTSRRRRAAGRPAGPPIHAD